MLKTILDSLEGVDDAVQQFYTEQDGKYVLQVEGVDNHPDVANLKSAYERVKEDKAKLAQERDDAKGKLKSIPDDFDPEMWERAKSGKADPEQLRKVREELESEAQEWRQKYEGLQSEMHQKALRNAVQSALAENGVPEGARRGAALDMLDGRKVEMQGEEPVIDTEMGPMPVADYAKRWVAKDGKAYVAMPTGGDAKGNPGGSAGSKKPEEMNAQDRKDLLQENPEEFYRLFPQAKLR